MNKKTLPIAISSILKRTPTVHKLVINALGIRLCKPLSKRDNYVARPKSHMGWFLKTEIPIGVKNTCNNSKLFKQSNKRQKWNEEEAKNIYVEEFIVEVLANLFRISNVILCYSICNVPSLSSTKGKDLVLGFTLRTLNLSHLWPRTTTDRFFCGEVNLE